MSYRGTGLAMVNADHPESFKVCDRCGAWRNDSDLTWQYDYRGNALQNLRILVCREISRCNDRPFEFYRPIIVGPDPVPTMDPRPEPFATDYGLQGFTALTLWNGGEAPAPYLTFLGDTAGDQIITDTNKSIVVGADFNQAAVLSEIVTLTDIPLPGNLVFSALTLAASQVPQQLLAGVPARSYVLIYNPTSRPIAVSEGVARMGALGSIQLGYGEALFWSTDQGAGDVYSGPMSWTGPWVDQPIWVWEAAP